MIDSILIPIFKEIAIAAVAFKTLWSPNKLTFIFLILKSLELINLTFKSKVEKFEFFLKFEIW